MALRESDPIKLDNLKLIFKKISFFRPEFLDHFDKKENDEEKKIRPEPESKPKPAPVVVEEKSPQLEIAKQNLQRQLQQIAGAHHVIKQFSFGH